MKTAELHEMTRLFSLIPFTPKLGSHLVYLKLNHFPKKLILIPPLSSLFPAAMKTVDKYAANNFLQKIIPFQDKLEKQ